MKRRAFLVAAIAASGSFATGAGAQETGKPKRVGWIGIGAAPNEPDAWMGEAFVARLRELGWVEGRTIEFLRRRPGAQADETRVEGVARELVRQKVDLIFAPFGAQAVVAHKVSGSIPLVFAVTSDPVRNGLTTSLARPDRNATGTSTLFADLWGPRIQQLSEVVPKPRKIAVLLNPDVAWQIRDFERIREACAKLGLAAIHIAVRRREDFDTAIERSVREGADALTHMPDGLFQLNRRALVQMVAHTRLAATYSGVEYVADGGLMTYAIDLRDIMRKAADYVDRILRGARASDLPIERPARVYLVLNQKTAKAQGITFPQSLLLRADRVIE